METHTHLGRRGFTNAFRASNSQVLRPRVSNGGLGSSIESSRSLFRRHRTKASTLLVALGVAFVADQISPRGYACILTTLEGPWGAILLSCHIFVGVDSFSILVNHRSFPKVVGGFLERRIPGKNEEATLRHFVPLARLHMQSRWFADQHGRVFRWCPSIC